MGDVFACYTSQSKMATVRIDDVAAPDQCERICEGDPACRAFVFSRDAHRDARTCTLNGRFYDSDEVVVCAPRPAPPLD